MDLDDLGTQSQDRDPFSQRPKTAHASSDTAAYSFGALLPFAKAASAAEQVRWSCHSPRLDISAIDLLSTAPETVKTAFS
ncbi:MAG: hypothetical protein HWE26_10990 [Alteromonadaceae bacterium]|nr:hypothetical protein [Alteromonadaceae bacterium]